MLDQADVVVCCQKFLAGWDEWRVCSVFLCKRTFSEEHLQQLLARATRARPGTGKKRPLIYDLANHPDDVCAAVSRFWKETHHYQGHLGEVQDLAVQITKFPGVDSVLSGCAESAALRPAAAAEFVARYVTVPGRSSKTSHAGR